MVAREALPNDPVAADLGKKQVISREHCNSFAAKTHNVEDAIETAKVATAAISITVHLYRGFHVIGFS